VREPRLALRRLRARAQHAFAEQRRFLAGAPRGPRAVLVVLGCQRSGTTLMTELLARDRAAKVYPEHSELSAGDRRHGLRLAPIPDVAARVRRSRHPLIVLKPLVESQNATALLAGLSNARALWMFRHYADVARSNLARFGEKNGIKNLRSIAVAADDWRSERVSEPVARVVREQFSEAMNPWDAAALFWWARNALFFEQSLGERDDVRTCRYEELVADPLRVLLGVYAFAGCEPPDRVSVAGVASVRVSPDHPAPISAEVARLCEQLLGRLEKAHAAGTRCA
jgi:hypothetical protein